MQTENPIASDILTSLGSDVIWLLVVAVFTELYRRFGDRAPILRSNLFLRIVVGQAGILLIALAALLFPASPIVILVVYFAASAFHLYTQLSVFHPFGIRDLHRTSDKGIGYEESLNLAKTKLDFLGIGGHKLTSLPAFVGAMDRCATHGRTVRLLLSSPNNPALEKIAKRNNVSTSMYQSRVKESLKTVADIAHDRGCDIQVRFYKSAQERDLPRFRLMLIDNEVGLFSYIIWSANEGRDNPQFVLDNHKRAKGTNLYRALEDYFEDIWNGSQAVNLGSYR